MHIHGQRTAQPRPEPLTIRTLRTGLLSAATAALTVAALAVPATAQAATAHPGANTPPVSTQNTKNPASPQSTKDAVALCPPASANRFTCFAMKRTDVKSSKGLAPDVTPSGYGPTDLAGAYDLPTGGGAGQTVAIVDAFDDPDAEADLAVYRSQFGLPECTTANGCFSKVDQNGGTHYPAPDPDWSGEISLDLDMVSAVAPQAHILLVEATSNDDNDLGASVDEAVTLGAKYVSNSYGSDYDSTPGSGEDPSELTAFDPFYNHPGVAVVASTGDLGYGVAYPAASQYVTSVGGTSLVRDSSSRGWNETVWNNFKGAPGSGCSLYEPKPAFQTDTGCSMRAEADVAAVADPLTGVAVYDSYQLGGWNVFGGTSASSPIIASVFADAGAPAAGTYPNSYPYANSGALNDITQGSDGTCTVSYLCTAGTGYDGPTGLGTPKGVSAFTTGPHGFVSGKVTDAATGGALAGAKVTVGDATATTTADGSYSVSVPPGSYTVSASDFGYATSTVDGVTVADGQNAAADFGLNAVARVAVTGKVTDGSGQGWPLYASLTVDGAPGGAVYTDPKTGKYSVNLPVDGTYTLHVSSNTPGYKSADEQVTVGVSGVVENVALGVDTASCTAAGYTNHYHGAFTSFDTTSVPDGWSVSNAAGTSGGWVFDDPGGRGNQTGGSGNFAIVDSDFDGSGNTQDSSLVSPATDMSANASPTLSFDTEYTPYTGSVADVDVSVDGGTTWSNVWEHADDQVPGSHVSIALPQAANQSAVQVRFHYTGSWAYYWEVDDVLLGTVSCDPVPGGLIVGQVTDHNTGQAVAGASVGSSATTATATTAATSDPAMTGAFYSLFAPAGAQTVTAAKGHYTTGAKSVTVTAGAAVRANFSLSAGRLTVTPSSLSKTLPWAGTGTSTVTVKNTGSAPATLNLGEGGGGFTVQSVKAAPLLQVKGTFPKSDMLKAAKSAKGAKAGADAKAGTGANSPAVGTAWSTLADFPSPTQDNIAEYSGGRLYSGFGFDGSQDTNTLYAFDPAAGSWSQLAGATDTRESPAHAFIGGKLYVAGGWGPTGDPDGMTEVYDPSADSWSTGPAWSAPLAGSGSAALGSKLYVVGGCATDCGSQSVSVLDTATGTWSTAANYPETTSWVACGALNGKIYCAGGTDGTSTSAHTYVYDPSADAWTKVADMPAGGAWGAASTAANGLLLVQDGVNGAGALSNAGYAYDPQTDSWSALPNTPNPAYRFGGALGFYTVGGGEGQFTTPLNVTQVLAGYDQGSSSDVPWLSESAASVTLAPGKSAKVTVSYNAADPSIVQPGTYTASLTLSSDTPYKLGSIPVGLKVNPPKTWGKIAGTVTTTDSAGKSVPLSGATIQIDTWTTHYTLHTGTDGGYALWLDVRNNPLTVIAAKDGYQPQVSTVKITRGGTVTTDFNLLKD